HDRQPRFEESDMSLEQSSLNRATGWERGPHVRAYIIRSGPAFASGNSGSRKQEPIRQQQGSSGAERPRHASGQTGAAAARRPGGKRIGRRDGPCTPNALRGSHGSSLASSNPFTRSRKSARAIWAIERREVQDGGGSPKLVVRGVGTAAHVVGEQVQHGSCPLPPKKSMKRWAWEPGSFLGSDLHNPRQKLATKTNSIQRRRSHSGH